MLLSRRRGATYVSRCIQRREGAKRKGTSSPNGRSKSALLRFEEGIPDSKSPAKGFDRESWACTRSEQRRSIFYALYIALGNWRRDQISTDFSPRTSQMVAREKLSFLSKIILFIRSDAHAIMTVLNYSLNFVKIYY